jgi:hypothetical protein
VLEKLITQTIQVGVVERKFLFYFQWPMRRQP